MIKSNQNHREILKSIARRAMLEKDLLPDFSAEVMAELNQMQSLSSELDTVKQHHEIKDLRGLIWSSIDNDDSNDLDQLTMSQEMPGNVIKIYVAVADVVSLVKNGSAIDGHARHNTTSVYTVAQIFPMLPEKVSTDLTSLNLNKDRLSIVVEMQVNPDGTVQSPNVYQAWVRNHAKLAYNSVAAWMEGNSKSPEALSAVDGLADNLRMQDKAAQRMKNLRHTRGALSLATIEAKPVFDGDQIQTLDIEEKTAPKRSLKIL